MLTWYSNHKLFDKLNIWPDHWDKSSSDSPLTTQTSTSIEIFSLFRDKSHQRKFADLRSALNVYFSRDILLLATLQWINLRCSDCVDISLNGPGLETIKCGHQTFVILSQTSSDPGLWLVNSQDPGLWLAGGDETWHFPIRGPQRLRTRNFNNQREIRQWGSSSLAQILFLLFTLSGYFEIIYGYFPAINSRDNDS